MLKHTLLSHINKCLINLTSIAFEMHYKSCYHSSVVLSVQSINLVVL